MKVVIRRQDSKPAGLIHREHATRTDEGEVRCVHGTAPASADSWSLNAIGELPARHLSRARRGSRRACR